MPHPSVSHYFYCSFSLLSFLYYHQMKHIIFYLTSYINCIDFLLSSPTKPQAVKKQKRFCYFSLTKNRSKINQHSGYSQFAVPQLKILFSNVFSVAFSLSLPSHAPIVCVTPFIVVSQFLDIPFYYLFQSFFSLLFSFGSFC